MKIPAEIKLARALLEHAYFDISHNGKDFEIYCFFCNSFIMSDEDDYEHISNVLRHPNIDYGFEHDSECPCVLALKVLGQ